MSRNRPFYRIMLMAAFITGGAAASAWAGDDIVNVVDRAKYAMQPPGFRSGSILFSPGIRLSETYDDNVYRKQTNKKSDFITVVRPSFSAVSDFNLHQLFFNAGGALGYYKDNTGENYRDYNITGGGRLDLDYETYLQLVSSYRKLHEGRDSPDDLGADKQVKYSLATHKASFTRALGIIKLYIDGIYNKFSFDDSVRNNVLIDNSGRDRDIYTLNMRVAYEYFPGYNVYAGLNQDWRRYRKQSVPSRDSDGREFQVGTDVFITGKMKADIYLGYLTHNYTGNFSDVSAFNYGGSLIWNATGLTTFTASAKRGVEETTFRDVSGDLKTQLSLGVDHMLRHNLFLSADTQVSFSDYESRTIPRDETSYGFGAGIEYVPFNGGSVSLNYNYSARDSSTAGRDFTDNRLTLNLSKQF